MQVTLRKGEYPTLTYVEVGPVTLAFSYETVVAFTTRETGWVVSENVWSRTTGKHLNAIVSATWPRTPHARFAGQLDALLARLDVTTVGA